MEVGTHSLTIDVVKEVRPEGPRDVSTQDPWRTRTEGSNTRWKVRSATTPLVEHSHLGLSRSRVDVI